MRMLGVTSRATMSAKLRFARNTPEQIFLAAIAVLTGIARLMYQRAIARSEENRATSRWRIHIVSVQVAWGISMWRINSALKHTLKVQFLGHFPCPPPPMTPLLDLLFLNVNHTITIMVKKHWLWLKVAKIIQKRFYFSESATLHTYYCTTADSNPAISRPCASAAPAACAGRGPAPISALQTNPVPRASFWSAFGNFKPFVAFYQFGKFVAIFGAKALFMTFFSCGLWCGLAERKSAI